MDWRVVGITTDAWGVEVDPHPREPRLEDGARSAYVSSSKVRPLLLVTRCGCCGVSTLGVSWRHDTTLVRPRFRVSRRRSAGARMILAEVSIRWSG